MSKRFLSFFSDRHGLLFFTVYFVQGVQRLGLVFLRDLVVTVVPGQNGTNQNHNVFGADPMWSLGLLQQLLPGIGSTIWIMRPVMCGLVERLFFGSSGGSKYQHVVAFLSIIVGAGWVLAGVLVFVAQRYANHDGVDHGVDYSLLNFFGVSNVSILSTKEKLLLYPHICFTFFAVVGTYSAAFACLDGVVDGTCCKVTAEAAEIQLASTEGKGRESEAGDGESMVTGEWSVQPRLLDNQDEDEQYDNEEEGLKVRALRKRKSVDQKASRSSRSRTPVVSSRDSSKESSQKRDSSSGRRRKSSTTPRSPSKPKEEKENTSVSPSKSSPSPSTKKSSSSRYSYLCECGRVIGSLLVNVISPFLGAVLEPATVFAFMGFSWVFVGILCVGCGRMSTAQSESRGIVKSNRPTSPKKNTPQEKNKSKSSSNSMPAVSSSPSAPAKTKSKLSLTKTNSQSSSSSLSSLIIPLHPVLCAACCTWLVLICPEFDFFLYRKHKLGLSASSQSAAMNLGGSVGWFLGLMLFRGMIVGDVGSSNSTPRLLSQFRKVVLLWTIAHPICGIVFTTFYPPLAVLEKLFLEAVRGVTFMMCNVFMQRALAGSKEKDGSKENEDDTTDYMATKFAFLQSTGAVAMAIAKRCELWLTVDVFDIRYEHSHLLQSNGEGSNSANGRDEINQDDDLLHTRIRALIIGLAVFRCICGFLISEGIIKSCLGRGTLKMKGLD